MTYEPKTIRIELNVEGNGFHPFKRKPYVEFFQELRHGTQRAVNTITRPFLTFPDGKTPKLVIEGEDQMRVEGAAGIDIDLAKIDWDAVNDVIIVGQVKEWSFGPVDQETLDGLPQGVRAMIVEEANQLYGKQVPLAKGGGGN